MANMGAIRERGDHDRPRRGLDGLGRRRGTPYLDAIASLWYCNIGHGRAELADAAAAQMRQLESYQTYERLHIAAGRGACRTRRGARAARGREGVLHLRRRRLDRHGRQARPRVLGGGRQAGQARDRLAPVRLPRLECLRHGARRHGVARRAATGGSSPRSSRCRGTMPTRSRRRSTEFGPEHGGRVLRRARHRRRRRHAPARGLPRRVQQICREREVLFVARRGDHGLRPPRRVVRLAPASGSHPT